MRVKAAGAGADKLKVPIFLKSENLNLESLGSVQACRGIPLLVLKSYSLRSKIFFKYTSWSPVKTTSIQISFKNSDT